MSVKMFGPAMDGSGTVVNRDVPELDVAAYEQAGYKKGSVDGAPTAEQYAELKGAPAKAKQPAKKGSK